MKSTDSFMDLVVQTDFSDLLKWGWTAPSNIFSLTALWFYLTMCSTRLQTKTKHSFRNVNGDQIDLRQAVWRQQQCQNQCWNQCQSNAIIYTFLLLLSRDMLMDCVVFMVMPITVWCWNIDLGCEILPQTFTSLLCMSQLETIITHCR